MTPFTGKTPGVALDDLQRRLHGTRWPDDPEAEPWRHGADGPYLRELVHYWMEHFDWPVQERALHRFAHFRANVDGFGVHFIYERSLEPNALPLITRTAGRARSWR